MVAAFVVYLAAGLAYVARIGRGLDAVESADAVRVRGRRLLPEDAWIAAAAGLGATGAAMWTQHLLAATITAVTLLVAWCVQRWVVPHHRARWWEKVQEARGRMPN
jgi:hypothetical protein